MNYEEIEGLNENQVRELYYEVIENGLFLTDYSFTCDDGVKAFIYAYDQTTHYVRKGEWICACSTNCNNSQCAVCRVCGCNDGGYMAQGVNIVAGRRTPSGNCSAIAYYITKCN